MERMRNNQSTIEWGKVWDTLKRYGTLGATLAAISVPRDSVDAKNVDRVLPGKPSADEVNYSSATTTNPMEMLSKPDKPEQQDINPTPEHPYKAYTASSHIRIHETADVNDQQNLFTIEAKGSPVTIDGKKQVGAYIWYHVIDPANGWLRQDTITDPVEAPVVTLPEGPAVAPTPDAQVSSNPQTNTENNSSDANATTANPETPTAVAALTPDAKQALLEKTLAAYTEQQIETFVSDEKGPNPHLIQFNFFATGSPYAYQEILAFDEQNNPLLEGEQWVDGFIIHNNQIVAVRVPLVIKNLQTGGVYVTAAGPKDVSTYQTNGLQPGAESITAHLYGPNGLMPVNGSIDNPERFNIDVFNEDSLKKDLDKYPVLKAMTVTDLVKGRWNILKSILDDETSVPAQILIIPDTFSPTQ